MHSNSIAMGEEVMWVQGNTPKVVGRCQYPEKWKTTVLQRGHRYNAYCRELISRSLKIKIGTQPPDVDVENENCHKWETVLRRFLEERDNF